MRHTIEFNDKYGVYMCAICGTAFTHDALVAEMDANGCLGPKAYEGTSTLMHTDENWQTSRAVIDAWLNTHMPRAMPYEDCETKGRRLLRSAGYDEEP